MDWNIHIAKVHRHITAANITDSTYMKESRTFKKNTCIEFDIFGKCFMVVMLFL